MTFLKDIKVRTQLLSAFAIIGLLMLYMSWKTYDVLSELDHAKNDLMKSYELAGQMGDAQYAVRTTTQCIMEFIACPDEKELEEWWALHQESVERFKTQINGMQAELSDPSWGSEFDELKAAINANCAEAVERHEKIMLPRIEDLYTIKKRLLKG